MILLDTDHLTVLRYVEHPRCAALWDRLRSAEDQRVAVTVISLEEQVRGWLAEISRWRDVHRQIAGYERLARLVPFFSGWEIVAFDARAADQFNALRKRLRRIGTQDLKIAAIALVNDVLLLSANLRDFQQVPGLRVENWLVGG
jgi:tRNA(fMet)-specific endonuclease VapC